jgi:hypothetical protein
MLSALGDHMVKYRFSGHETFPCRYAWLPKAYAALDADPRAFADDAGAMVSLGLGKNMVRALRFWVQAMRVAEPTPNGEYALTDFGRSIFAAEGHDPFLEDVRTLWLLHWRLCSHTEEPLFAWDYLLNRWQEPEITRGAVVLAFQREAERLGRDLSPTTLEQHFDVFLHSYVPTRSRKGSIQEDNLDCPLVELELIQRVGERRLDSTGKREVIYAFRREDKPEISPALFIYCIDDFWCRHRRNEQTLTFRDIAVAHGSLGQVFKLPELSIRERLESIETDSGGVFSYRESASLQQLSRGNMPLSMPLEAIYDGESVHA